MRYFPILLLLGTACSNPAQWAPESAPATFSQTAASCAIASELTLWAGQHLDAGTVTIVNDATHLHVTLNAAPGYSLTESHLDVSATPFTERGAPGKYAHKATHRPAVTTFTYSIPMSGGFGDAVHVRVHASVRKPGGGSESAFGGVVIKPARGSWFGQAIHTLSDPSCEDDNPPPPPPPVVF